MPETQPTLSVTLPAKAVRSVVMQRAAQRNALSRELLAELTAIVRTSSADGTRVLVLSGAGPHYCAGADLNEVRGTSDDASWFRAMETLTGELRRAPFITVAAIHGSCVGAGLELAMSFDLRLATVDAMFSLPSLRMGLLYAPTTLRRMVSLVGPTVATRVIVEGHTLDGHAAHDAGLVTGLVDSPIEDAHAWAERVLEASPVTAVSTVMALRSLSGEAGLIDQWRIRHEESWTSVERRAAVNRAQVAKASS